MLVPQAVARDAHRPLHRAGLPLGQPPIDVLEVGQDRAGLLQQRLAGGRQALDAVGALHQLQLELILQAAERLAHGLRRHVQPIGRLLQVERLRERHEVAQPIGVQGILPSFPLLDSTLERPRVLQLGLFALSPDSCFPLGNGPARDYAGPE